MDARTFTLSCLLLAFVSSAWGVEFIDGDNEPPTQMNGMHGCNSAFLVTGVHVGRNLLLCSGPFQYLLDFPSTLSWGVLPSNQFPFDGTSMHWCGPNSMVRGVHVDGNGFDCVSFNQLITTLHGGLGAPFLDRSTQRAGMHACPVGSVLVGAHFSTNTFLCATLPVCADSAQCRAGTTCRASPGKIYGVCQ